MFETLVNSAKGGVYVIAEACDNHMGSIEMAKALCRAAKSAGADAVKFQHHLAYEEMLKEGDMSDNFDEHLYDFLETNALNLDQHHKLRKYCDEIGITYLCTPFSLKAAHEVSELVPFYKIGSGEFQDLWFIDGLSKIGKPVLFSSGMSSYSELTDNVRYLRQSGLNFAILNCLSEYPPNFDDMNLRVISKLISDYPDIIIGHSDHTQTTFTSSIAVSLGAKIIEKHLTLSHSIHGPDKDVSLDPTEFEVLVKDLRDVNRTMGNSKVVNFNEKAVRSWAYRSVVAAVDIPAGSKISVEQLCTKRPGTGIPSKNYKALVGRKVLQSIPANSMIMWDDLE